MREEKLSRSNQLLLGELKLKLDVVKDKNKPIVFDFGMRPSGASSYRGYYCELGLEYSETGGGSAFYNGDVVHDGDYGRSYKEVEYKLPELPSAYDFIDMLNEIAGKDMVGYKGGDYTMHKNVAVYVANYGSTSIENYKGKEHPLNVIVVDVIESDNNVTIITEEDSE